MSMYARLRWMKDPCRSLNFSDSSLLCAWRHTSACNTAGLHSFPIHNHSLRAFQRSGQPFVHNSINEKHLDRLDVGAGDGGDVQQAGEARVLDAHKHAVRLHAPHRAPHQRSHLRDPPHPIHPPPVKDELPQKASVQRISPVQCMCIFPPCDNSFLGDQATCLGHLSEAFTVPGSSCVPSFLMI